MFRLPQVRSHRIGNIPSALTLLFLIALPLTLLSQTPDLQVRYTGRLFGYYRIEPDETIPNIKLPTVGRFLASPSLVSPKNVDSLLLGMGDNFGPEFGASIQQEFRSQANLPAGASCSATLNPPEITDTAQWHRSAPEALYKSETRMPVLADCDNVTRFLMTSGYRAIVPGREDFLYSATWLRRIAFLLRGASSGAQVNPIPGSGGKWTFGSSLSPSRPFNMLAANIRVKTSSTSCPLLFAWDLASKDHPCLASDGSITEEMEWFRRLDKTLDSYAVEDSLERQANSDMQFRMQLVVNQINVLSKLLAGYKCSNIPPSLAVFSRAAGEKGSPYAFDKKTGALILNTASEDPGDPATPDEHNLSGQEIPKRSQQLSALTCQTVGELTGTVAAANLQRLAEGTLKAVHTATTVQPRSPQGNEPPPTILVPRSLRWKALELFLNLIYVEQKDTGFTIAELPSGKHALIIAVTGQETMQAVSKANLKVYPNDQDCHPSSKNLPGSVCEASSLDKAKSFEVSVGDPHLAVTAVLRAAAAERDHELEPNATINHPLFDTVIVMAQMQSAEAEELAERVRADIQTSYSPKDVPSNAVRPAIDLVLSEARHGYETPNFAAYIEPGTKAPVLVPPDASARLGDDPGDSVSIASFSSQTFPGKPTLSRLLSNEVSSPTNQASSTADASDPNCEAAACLLKEQLQQARVSWFQRHPGIKPPTNLDSDLDSLWNSCKVVTPQQVSYNDRSCQNAVLMQYLLRHLQQSSRADIVLLERRDFYFDHLGAEYGKYEVCDRWVTDAVGQLPQHTSKQARDDYEKFYTQYCQLHVALDRVLWKGDHSERVMVDGATLAGLMKTAQQQTDQEQSLLAHDVYQEWLMTYGIATTPPQDLVTASSGPQTFSIPGTNGCNNTMNKDGGGSGAGKPSGAAAGGNAGGTPGSAVSPYCINGQSVQSDRAYWLTTSDHLAQNTTVYAALGAVSATPHYASPESGLYITTEIADELTRHSQSPELMSVTKPQSPAGKSENAAPAEANMAVLEMLHQDRNLIQLDFAKLVAGYTLTSPSLSDAALATDLTGISNTQALTPHQQELDLEEASRLTSAPLYEWFVLGAQTDGEYDRKVLGNLTGNPETVTYSANNFTVGGFTQVAIHSRLIPGLARNGINQSTRNLPRAFLVLAPYQYQRQITGAFINFPFFTPPSTSNPQEQVTVHIPTVTSFNQRAGLRYEFARIWKWSPDPGSYAEIGPEYSVQNNILAALDLPQLSSSAVCKVTATQSLQTCVKNAYKAAGVSLNASSTLIPVTETLHAGGIYWMVHLQKAINKNYSASFDTQGDNFLLPGATLTTQTRYAFSTKLALNFKIAGNLSLSPTWSDFFYENQGISSQRTSLVATTFTISAKWYFARDAQVPFRKQTWYVGPASTDQTTSAKVK